MEVSSETITVVFVISRNDMEQASLLKQNQSTETRKKPLSGVCLWEKRAIEMNAENEKKTRYYIPEVSVLQDSQWNKIR